MSQFGSSLHTCSPVAARHYYTVSLWQCPGKGVVSRGENGMSHAHSCATTALAQEHSISSGETLAGAGAMVQ